MKPSTPDKSKVASPKPTEAGADAPRAPKNTVAADEDADAAAGEDADAAADKDADDPYANVDKDADSAADEDAADKDDSDDEHRVQPRTTTGAVDSPPFLDALPADPELLRIAAAFSCGNYAEVQRRVPLLVKASDNQEVVAAALDLQRRIAPDPLVKYLLFLSALLLLVLVVFAYGHGH